MHCDGRRLIPIRDQSLSMQRQCKKTMEHSLLQTKVTHVNMLNCGAKAGQSSLQLLQPAKNCSLFGLQTFRRLVRR